MVSEPAPRRESAMVRGGWSLQETANVCGFLERPASSDHRGLPPRGRFADHLDSDLHPDHPPIPDRHSGGPLWSRSLGSQLRPSTEDWSFPAGPNDLSRSVIAASWPATGGSSSRTPCIISRMTARSP